MQAEKLVILVGLKRSGLHGMANWLLGLEPGARLVNNSPMKRLGWSSSMSRTDRTSPLPLRLYAGHTALAIDRQGREHAAVLRDREPLLVVLFQSQSLAHLSEQLLLEGVQAGETHVLLQLRDPFNWSASYKAKSQELTDNQLWPQLWREYASEYAGISSHFPRALRVNYNRWLTSASCREQLAARLDLAFVDHNLGLVTNHAGGSSFDAMRFDGEAGAMNLASRWEQFRDDPEYIDCFRSNPDIVRMGLELFELPASLRRFCEDILSCGAISTGASANKRT